MEDIKRLPLTGPLEIENLEKFLEKSKAEIDKLLNVDFKNYAEFKDFEAIQFLGKGSFGKVYFVKNNKTDTLHAMKELDKKLLVKKNQLNNVKNEINLLKCMNFLFTLHLEYFFQSLHNLYVITPFVECGEMFIPLLELGHFEEHVSRFYGAQVVLGLEYLHYSDIIYRDLKPENILIDQTGYLKLCDIGFSKIVQSRTYTICGTPEYFAPEMILNLGYGKSADWWALGVLIYELNFGKTPFRHKNSLKLHENTLAGSYSMPKYFSSELKDLIKNILVVDVTSRFGCMVDAVNDIKNHAWFQSIKWMSILNRLMTSPFIPKTKQLEFNNYNPRQTVTKVKLLSKVFKDF